ncbi:hypothetical protein GF396_05525 [Candidatus Pacearchaeota archaeon]|nr:hypothetical protein [Candidatus Pacearchaeota archaeon]
MNVNSEIATIQAPESEDFKFDVNYALAYPCRNLNTGDVIVIGLAIRNNSPRCRVRLIGEYGISESADLTRNDGGYAFFREQLEKGPLILNAYPDSHIMFVYDKESSGEVLTVDFPEISEDFRLVCWGDNYWFKRLNSVIGGMNGFLREKHPPNERELRREMHRHKALLLRSLKTGNLEEVVKNSRFFTKLFEEHRDLIPVNRGQRPGGKYRFRTYRFRSKFQGVAVRR